MTTTIRLCTDRFPEPAFSHLQRAVFSQVQVESPALAQVLVLEREASPGPGEAFQPAMVRFGAYVQDELVGWSCGWVERGGTFYMAHSGVVPSHQRKGIYSALLERVVAHAREAGAHTVRSQHSVLNNSVIVCKLQRGFHIAGLSFSAHMGSLVELVHHVSGPRMALFRGRAVPFVAPGPAEAPGNAGATPAVPTGAP